jgi:histidinol-phosphate phosphatase family protein
MRPKLKPTKLAPMAPRTALEPVSEYLTNLGDVLAALPREPIAAIAEALLEAAEADRTVYSFGNGGSAATASHLVCDLVRTSTVPGHPSLRAVALSDNVPMLTAISNDLSYEEAFAEQVRLLARVGDVVFAISASGNSPNVIKGVTAARELGATIIGVTGFGGGQLRTLSDICLVVPSHEYGPVEDVHMVVVHAVTAALRAMRGTSPRSPLSHEERGSWAPRIKRPLQEAMATHRAPEPDSSALPQAARRAPTIFLDRDGVINRNRDDYVKGWHEFEFLPGALRAMARLSRAGCRIFVVTNQACIGKGLTSLAAVEDLHQRLRDEVARAGGRIEAVLFCPHRADEGCACRKPNPGLLLRARDQYGVDLSDAVFIGDSASDMRAAVAADLPAMLVLSGLGWRAARAGAADQPHVRMVARDLEHAVSLILGGSLFERAEAPLLQALVRAARLPIRARQWLGQMLAPQAPGAPVDVIDTVASMPRV